MTITEDSFKLGSSCPTKVQYLSAGLPRGAENDSMGKWMRTESGKVRALARHFFPDAVDIPDGAEGFAFTQSLLESGTPVAGARFATYAASCRVDFAARDDSKIRLYQVVTKAIDLSEIELDLEFVGKNGRIRSEWWSAIELMAYRVGIVQRLWPEHRVIPLYIAPIKDAVGQVEGLHGMFEDTPLGWRTTHPATAAQASRLIRQFSILKECLPLVPSVIAKVYRLIATLETPPPPQLGYGCGKCEFRTPGSGFDLCWGSLKDVSPSAWSMPWLYNIKENGVPVFNRLARQRTVSLWDIPVDLIKGAYAPRQLMLLECTATNREIIKPALATELARLEYPLAFLDIEAYRTVVPNKGGRVGGITMFQFSLDVIAAPGAEPEHFEYLDSGPGDPNPRFLAALRAKLGDRGSCLCWSTFEVDSFSSYRDDRLRSETYDDDVLWLDRLIVGTRLVDQCALCQFYMHPKSEGGSASIKAVLPAVWSEDTPAKRQKLLDGFPLNIDPYTFLRESGCLSEGVGAMTGFVAMLAKTAAEREKIRYDLLRYCAVDTAAQVIIYLHWKHLLEGASGTSAEVNVPARNDATLIGTLPDTKGIAA